MEVRVYDRDINFLGIIDDFVSLIWTRKYNECGTFELYAPAAYHNIVLLKPGNLIVRHKNNHNRSDDVEAGVISIIDTDDEKNQIICKGNFLPIYLDRRIIPKTINFAGKADAAMYNLVTCVTPIPLLRVGKYTAYEPRIEFQCSYKNLLSYLEKIAKVSTLGFKVTVNLKKKYLMFSVYQGIDRTENQKSAKQIVFSEKYDNINGTSYYHDDSNLKTYALIGGDGEGSNRKFTEIDLGGNGLDRREIFIDAKDIKSDDLTSIIDEAYKRADEAKQRAEELEYRMLVTYSDYSEALKRADAANDLYVDLNKQTQDLYFNMKKHRNLAQEYSQQAANCYEAAEKYEKLAKRATSESKKREYLELAQEEEARAKKYGKCADEEYFTAGHLEVEYKQSKEETTTSKNEARILAAHAQDIFQEYEQRKNEFENAAEEYKTLQEVAEKTEQQGTVEYINLLKMRGLEKLANMIVTESIECEVNDNNKNYIYGDDYDLGDVVTVKSKKYGVALEQRITEVREIWEYGAEKTELTFGIALPEKIDLNEE